MPYYDCEYCNYSSKLKSNFERHVRSKKHLYKLIESGLLPNKNGAIIQNNPALIPNNPLAIQNNPLAIQNNPLAIQNNPLAIQNNPASIQNNQFKKVKCDFCSKMFTIHSNKRRHEMYRCKESPEFLKLINDNNIRIQSLQNDKETLEKDKEKLEDEKKELYKQVSTLLDKVGDTNIQNNIILNSYGKEDLSHITDTLKTELLSIPYGAIPKMIEAIHFNDQKPENKNIMIPNKKENLVKVFEGDKWIYKNKTETITDLVDSKYNIIDDHYVEMDNDKKVSSHIKTTFTKFRTFYEVGDEEIVANLKKECELVLLNNR